MNVHAALAVSALVASAALFFTAPSRLLAVIALVASGVEVAMTLGVVHLAIAHLPLRIVLALALAVPGLLAWFRSAAKTATSAAAIVAFVGALQVASELGPRL
jgi:hypothetical protein